MAKRKAITKKKRFEIFKRDEFMCQYCGATPPNVLLQIDHITPVAEGGDNDIDNLVTSCQPCNIGKSNNLLTNVPASLKQRADETKEKEDQIKEYNKILMDKKFRLHAESWEIAEILENQMGIENYPKDRLFSIEKFLEKLPYAEVMEAAEIAFNRKPTSGYQRFRFFCGVCWRKIKGDSHAAGA